MANQPRILVADDDADMRRLIATILGGGSYEVVLCEDAESALVHLRESGPFDALISDFMLPGISGLDLVAQIRADAKISRIPVLMISAHINYAMQTRAAGVGATAFLNKPFTLSQLRNALSALLRGGNGNAGSGGISGIPKGGTITSR